MVILQNQNSRDSKTTEVHEGNQFKKIFRYSGWYLLSSLSTKAVSFLLLPLYTHYLSPTDYGILATLQSITELLPTFISLYLDAAFGRFYFDKKRVSPESLRKLFSTIFWFILIWGAVVCGLALWVSNFAFKPLLGLPFSPHMVIAFAPLFLLQLNQLGRVFLNATMQPRRLFIIDFSGMLIGVVTVVYFLVFREAGILAKFLGTAVSALSTFVLFGFVYKRHNLLSLDFSLIILKKSLVYSVPLIPNVASGWITRLSDRLIMTYHGQVATAGLYSVGAQIAMIIYFVNDALTQVQGAISMSSLTAKAENAHTQISQFTSFYMICIWAPYLAISLFSYELLQLISKPEYHGAHNYVAILGIAYVFSGFYRIYTTVISANNKTFIISSAAIIAAVISLGANLVLIPKFGGMAAAWANAIGVLAYTIWVFLFAQKYAYTKISWSPILLISLFAMTLLAVGLLIQQSNFQPQYIIMFKISLISLYVFVAFVYLQRNGIFVRSN